eukprot:TRINITY_DN46295_c0_g1_i1.p1 TRINITY_DN46295_c0_g1~~TRINITY_DN46295_c0_g1_i1.p1  ORF type:complete len:228 (+),score=47.88 TRINITY_DN46295_c0_g1_i1:47-730(+)
MALAPCVAKLGMSAGQLDNGCVSTAPPLQVLPPSRPPPSASMRRPRCVSRPAPVETSRDISSKAEVFDLRTPTHAGATVFNVATPPASPRRACASTAGATCGLDALKPNPVGLGSGRAAASTLAADHGANFAAVFGVPTAALLDSSSCSTGVDSERMDTWSQQSSRSSSPSPLIATRSAERRFTREALQEMVAVNEALLLGVLGAFPSSLQIDRAGSVDACESALEA